MSSEAAAYDKPCGCKGDCNAINRPAGTYCEWNHPGRVAGAAYVFLHRRPTDKQAWPVIYTDKALAEACKFRVSDVVPVGLPQERKP